MKVLIANRGEIALRIHRAVSDLGWQTQRVHASSETPGVGSFALRKSGASGYLDREDLVAAAISTHSAMIHPGYGFLSEDPEFARACAAAGVTFVGPSPEMLELFGDKVQARNHAERRAVPVVPSVGIGEAAELLRNSTDGIVIKSVAGGGGRGIRHVEDPKELASSIASCRAEAKRSFGLDELYVEQFLARVKHVEIQLIGDGTGKFIVLGERDCSVQRNHQKLMEVAPSPVLSDEQREILFSNALQLMSDLPFAGLATVEFLVQADTLGHGKDLGFAFIEVNPRLQVEHTVTEQVFGIDLVKAQLQIAHGAELDDLDLHRKRREGTFSIQLRINAEERVGRHFGASVGTISHVRMPENARVETHAAPGLEIDGTFDSLIAKIITTTDGSFEAAVDDALKALDAVEVSGVTTNAELLKELLEHPDVRSGAVDTSLLDEILAGADEEEEDNESGQIVAKMSGTIATVHVQTGDLVPPQTPLLTVESMKMEHPVTAGVGGFVESVDVVPGEQVRAGRLLVRIRPVAGMVEVEGDQGTFDLDLVRPDLQELKSRLDGVRDSARPEAVAKRHSTGHLTAREYATALMDPGTFLEYGSLPVAAQRGRRSIDDLIARTPADGIITGVGRVDGQEVAFLAYDYTVLAGTQGYFNHLKTDRLLAIAARESLPVIFFAEGGGGRPGDVDVVNTMAALSVPTFADMGRLSGKVPLIGVLTGRCFAGNAALLACCDVIIATADSNLGMAGPALIEGGGLGRFTPDEIGPMDVQAANGVVDVVVSDDHEAIATASRYLGFFREGSASWSAGDQRILRHLIPENRKAIYDIRRVITELADEGSFLELRREFGPGLVTGLLRIEGMALAVVANNPGHLGGAIDADEADKMAHFLQVCDAHAIPILSLCDTPGFMVGPEAESRATVRRFGQLFIAGSQLSVPMLAVVLRKGYGLGAQAMAGGGFNEPVATVAWPTGEIGGMGLEGLVRLGFAKELEAIADPECREARYQELLAQEHLNAKAISAAMRLEVDEVIDPAETRRWITMRLGRFDRRAGKASSSHNNRQVDAATGRSHSAMMGEDPCTNPHR